MSEVRRALVTLKGVTSPCLEAGVGPEGVVFVHGNPGAAADWRALVGAAGEFMAAVAPDMPGFGEADKPADFNYTIEGYAQHLHALIEHLKLQRVHLVLHDFGGPWGLTYAATHPEKVASITLINTGVLKGYRWHIMGRLWRLPWLGELVMAATSSFGFTQMLKRGNPRGLPAEAIARMYRDFDAGTRRAVLRLYRASSDVDGYSDFVRKALLPLDLPALVLWGRHDVYIPSVYAWRQRETFPSAEVLMLPDSGHFPHLDDPRAVHAPLMSFLLEQMKP